MSRLSQREPRSEPGRKLSVALAGALGLAVFGFGVAPGSAAAETLWQIGTFDRSSAEFRQWIDPVSGGRFDYADPAADPVFVVGRSKPENDWLAYQPGTANGGAGYRAHPFTVEFELNHPITGQYRLTLALLAYSARLPVLRVEINGRQGALYQQPRLNYEAGDHAVFFLPHYATADLTCELPPAFLRPGTNRLVFTAMDEPVGRDDTRPAGFPWPGSSGIHYDALRLERFETGEPSPANVRVEPTIFYHSHPAGLRERVDVTVTANRSPTRVELRLGNASWTREVDSGRAFGEWRSEFLVPELPGPTEARVQVEFDQERREFVTTISPARKWTVFVVPNVHLDIGYTDFAPKVSEIQSRLLDRALELAEEFPDFRFTPDGFWPVEEFWRGRTPAHRERLVDAVRRGHISLPVVHSSPFTGFASLENLIRLLYPGRRFAREHGTPFEFALATDVPNYSWSLASVLASSGVRYFVAASDAYRAPFLLYNRFHEQSPQWWEGPDGKRILTWYSRHYHQLSSLFGLPPQLASGRDSLPRFLQAYDRPDYRSDGVILYGSQAENADLHPAQASLVRDWNGQYAYPRLKFASFPEALDDIISQTGTNLPVKRGDGGPYWEDGLGANARTTALARENMYRILSAEKAGTISALVNPRFEPDREALGRAWRNLLLVDEHTWHADSSVREPLSLQSQRQGALKDSRATEAQRQIDHVLVRSLAALADQVRSPAGGLVVFNPLSWRRSGWVQLDLPRRMILVDLQQGQPVPTEVLYSGNAFDHVRFAATDVPSVGYKCYSIRPGPEPAIAPTNTGGVQLESRFYRVSLDPQSGRIVSITDRELEQELVDAEGDYAFNEYLYVTGGDDLPNRLVQYSTVAPQPELTVHRPTSSRLLFVQRSALGMKARIESSGINTPRIETEIFLPADEKRIEFSNRVQKTYTLRKEGAYFAWPFNVKQPRFRYATQSGFVDPARDLLPGAGREWFTAHQWVEVGNEHLSIAWVPVDAPLFTLGDIARGSWPREFGQRPATIFSYVMNNYTPEGYQAGQGGEFVFRYQLTSRRTKDAAALHRFGLEALTPLELNEITRNDKTAPGREWLPALQASFLEVDQENLSLLAWKSSEVGEATVLRFLETAGRRAPARLRFPAHRIQSAVRCNAVEDELEPVPCEGDELKVEVRPHEFVTLKVRLEMKRP